MLNYLKNWKYNMMLIFWSIILMVLVVFYAIVCGITGSNDIFRMIGESMISSGAKLKATYESIRGSTNDIA